MTQPCSTGEAGHALLVLNDDSAVRNSLTFSLEIEGFDIRGNALLDRRLSHPSLGHRFSPTPSEGTHR
jgi:hypothetical protein